MDTTQDLRQRFGCAVRLRRNDLGVSQEVLAERAGLHRTYIADIERGARNPTLRAIERLAQALETPIGALFPLAEASADRLEIVLVEDDPRDVKLTLRAFKTAGLLNPVQVATDGVEALELLLATDPSTPTRPRLVLLDLGLPRLDGIEVLRRLKGEERTRSIPVIILTASHSDRHIEQCRELGAYSYILKPVDFQRLAQVTPDLRLSWILLQPLIAT